MTYDELLTSVTLMLKREEDADLISALPTFVRFIEAEINRGRRVVQMEVRSRTTLESGRWAYGWPNDFLGLRSISMIEPGGKQSNMEFLPPEQLIDLNETQCTSASGSGVTWYYTIHNDMYQIAPIPAFTEPGYIEVVYYQAIPPLGGLDKLGGLITENWLSTQFPDIYYYGLCKHAQPFIFNDERLATMAAMYQTAVGGLYTNNDKQTWSGTTMRMRVRGSY